MKRTELSLTVFSALLITLLLVTSRPSLKADTEVPQLQWSKTYNGDSGLAVQTADGGYAIAAKNASIWYPALERAPMLIKTDSSGNLQWSKIFETVGLVGVNSIVQTKDSGYAISGTSIAPPILNPVYSGWLIKTDDKGTVQWNKTFEDPLETCHVIQTSDGGYALTGYMANSANGANGLLLKMDEKGNTVWSKTFGGNSSKVFILNIAEANNGGYVLVGNRDQDGWLAKTDNEGDLQWSQTYHSSGFAALLTLAKTSDGGYILSGGTIDTGLLIKTDSNGNSQWTKDYSASPLIGSVLQTADGGFIVASSHKRQACLIKTYSSGLLLYNVSYGEVNENLSSYASSVVTTNDGGYAVSGTLNHYSPTTTEGLSATPSETNNVWLAKFAPESNSSPNGSEPLPIIGTVAALIVVVIIVAAGLGLLTYLIKRK